jgi:hypothetical protein
MHAAVGMNENCSPLREHVQLIIFVSIYLCYQVSGSEAEEASALPHVGNIVGRLRPTALAGVVDDASTRT